MNKFFLIGMCCPKCKSEGPYAIIVTSLAIVYDDGIEYGMTPQWNSQSFCRCQKCQHSATVKDFMEEKLEELIEHFNNEALKKCIEEEAS